MINQPNENSDDDILNTSYELFVVINTSNDKNFNMNNVKRVVLTLMTHLNDYSLEHCSPLSSKYSMDNPTDDLITHPNQMESELDSFVNMFTNNKKSNSHAFLNIRSFYENSVKKEPIVVAYQNVFDFYWREEKKSIVQIFENIKSIVLNPSHVLAFYDIYLKFIIFASYYELKLIFCYFYFNYFELIDYNRYQKKFDPNVYNNFRELIENNFNENKFPEHYSPLKHF